MTPEAMRELYEYMYWAFDERVWPSITQLDDTRFIEDVNYSIGSIRNQVVHLMSATRRWMSRLAGREVMPHLTFEDYTTLTHTKATWDRLRPETLAYVSSLDQAQLDELVHWEISSRGIARDNRRWELLLHVANHATDHRAQILTVLNLHFGIQTIEQDMLFYFLEDR
jgi:uncharacterized damage-inducible protein DinB